MICGSTFQYKLIKDKFWYDGEILKSGIPRYDIFFNKDSCNDIRKRVFTHFNIPESSKIVLYAPTFRTGNSLHPYNIDWQTCVPLLKEIFGEDVVVLLRLHPNMLRVDTSQLLNHQSVLDATRYHDMQELLLVSDLLITDYSSTMFDMSMIDKPCMLYATDIEEYDRGYYFDFKDLPFPLAKNMDEFTEILRSFDLEKYKSQVREFLDNTIGMFEDGNASKRIVEWMSRHRI
jgi:CDP-glycerol glycerophosphotransferase